jgi:AAA15 family ATPase/GTPase
MKINKIDIENFRGITKEKSLLFLKKQTDTIPSSCIIFGDNGSGKSSIIDAIEFGLQCRIDNTRNFENEFIPDIRALNSKINSKVNVVFEDNSNIQRIIKFDDFGIINKIPHLNYKSSPIVLRRKDIIKFWDTPTKQRLVHLLDYFPENNANALPEYFKNQVLAIENQRDLQKKERFAILQQIANTLNISIHKIPVENKSFDKFISKYFFLGLSKKHFPDNSFPNSDKYTIIEKFFKPFYETNKIIGELNKDIKLKKNPVLEVEQKKSVSKFLNIVSQNILTDFYVFSTCNEFVDDIKIVIGEINEVSLTFSITTKNGTVTTPQKILSEANLDLLAILIHLRIIKTANEEFNQGKLLILDDILQSVDYNIRYQFIDFLMTNFNDWQIIFTVHDRLWRQNLADCLSKKNHSFVEYEIKRWEWKEGPIIIDNYSDRFKKLENYINNGTEQEICAYCGYLLEFICEELTYILNLALPRERGEKYTLDPLWTAVKNSKLTNTSIKNLIKKVDDTIKARNLLGAHYNEWALGMTNQDVQNFGQSVLDFYKSVFLSRLFPLD